MSNVIYMADFKLRKQAQGVQKVSRLVLGQMLRKQQIEGGLEYLKRLPRPTIPDHEPPGAA